MLTHPMKKPKLKARHWLLLAITALVIAYPASLVWIHTSNARHERVWDNLRAHARMHGIPTRPTPDQLDLIHFYDQSQPYTLSYGGTNHMQGFKNAAGEIVIAPTYFSLDKHFHEGLVSAVLADKTQGFIRPDESVAFITDFDYVEPFVNGMAMVRRKSDPNEPFPPLRHGFIDQTGTVVVETKYDAAKDYVGDYTMVRERTIYSPIYDNLMDGLDIDVGLQWLLPNRLRFLDKEGNRVSPSTVKRSLR